MYERLVIIGKSGVGKTTLAATLADRLGLKHVEMDALHWEANWVEAPDDVMVARLEAALPESGRWVSDGNYARMRGVVWARGQTVIWLDYPLGLALMRLLRRTVGRIFWGTELWNGNRENVLNHLTIDTDENLFLWTIKSHWQQRVDYENALNQPEYKHLHVIRLRSPAETDEWLAALPACDSIDTSLDPKDL